MGGIAGLIHRGASADIGTELTAMLQSLKHRGPDSTGFALYGNPAGERYVMRFKVAEQEEARKGFDIQHKMRERKAAVDERLAELGAEILEEDTATDYAYRYIFQHDGDMRRLADYVEDLEGVEILSLGHALELIKDLGDAGTVSGQYSLNGFDGTHAIGHTRMATESAVTTEHSHPFSTGRDLCLVHNGSLSNHNRLRAWLRRHGVEIQTDNDSEVAAGYLTHRLGEGASLKEALAAAVKDLDGFFTFAVGTRDGFAVVRDPIACKHAVLAETDQWVAMATEYRAIAKLPGSDRARIWEPVPGEIYSWERTGDRPGTNGGEVH